MEHIEQISSAGSDELVTAQEQAQPDLQAPETGDDMLEAQTDIAVDAQTPVPEGDPHQRRRLIISRVALGVGIVILAGVVGAGVKYAIDVNTPLANNVQTAPASTAPSILTSPVIATPASSIPEATPSPTVLQTPTPTAIAEAPAAPAEIAPSAPQRLVIPKLGIDAHIQSVDSEPTGEKNAMGGDVYREIEFPLDMDARYWERGGLPNTVASPDMSTEPQAGLRTIIYGHASDIGNTWLFQHLADMQIGDVFTMDTATHTFTYTVYKIATPPKDALSDDVDVYGLPENGQKEVALVGCYPERPSHAIVIAVQTNVSLLPK